MQKKCEMRKNCFLSHNILRGTFTTSSQKTLNCFAIVQKKIGPKTIISFLISDVSTCSISLEFWDEKFPVTVKVFYIHVAKFFNPTAQRYDQLRQISRAHVNSSIGVFETHNLLLSYPNQNYLQVVTGKMKITREHISICFYAIFKSHL